MGTSETNSGSGPPDYTSISPVKYGRPDTISNRDGDIEADPYYLVEDTGTRPGSVPKEVPGEKCGTARHGSTSSFTDEVSTPLVTDPLGRLYPAHNIKTCVKKAGEPDAESREEPRSLPARNVGRISYTK